jgi:PKD repeat protein
MACFDANPTTIGAGQSVNLTSTCSMDAHHYEWEFGDGGTSMDTNPSHTYNTTGSYTVKLKTMSKNSKKMDETSKPITVN